MSSQTLPADPSVTVYFDGLILLVQNKARRLCQAGIHTQAPHHALQITVRKKGDEELSWPNKESPWDGSHKHVKAIAPLWLYVDSGKGLQEDDFFADSYMPEGQDDEHSFGNVLDFEGGLYKRPLHFLPAPLAILNVAQGVFYSDTNGEFILKSLADGQAVEMATAVGGIKASSLVAAAIDASSSGDVERHIVLEQERPERRVLFRIKLEEGARYEINIRNVPERQMPDMPPGHEMPDMSPAAHFLQYYKLFPLEDGEPRFIVEPVVENPEDGSSDSPPCNVGRGSLTGSLA